MFVDHGLAVRAVAIRVKNAVEAFELSTQNGAIAVLPPLTITDKQTGKFSIIAEIKFFDDTVIRWISGDYVGPALPNYEIVKHDNTYTFGIQRIDHVVCNVPNLFEGVDYLIKSIGFHEFSEFTTEDVGTLDSGLNSMVLANNNEFVLLLPINEPTFGCFY